MTWRLWASPQPIARCGRLECRRATSPSLCTLVTVSVAAGQIPGQTGRASRLLMIEQGGRGGVADYTAELTSALAAEGWQVVLATADDHRYQPTSGVTVHSLFHYVRGRSRLGRAVRRAGARPDRQRAAFSARRRAAGPPRSRRGCGPHPGVGVRPAGARRGRLLAAGRGAGRADLAQHLRASGRRARAAHGVAGPMAGSARARPPLDRPAARASQRARSSTPRPISPACRAPPTVAWR